MLLVFGGLSSDTGELPLADGFGLDPIASRSGADAAEKWAIGGQVFPRFGSCATEIPPPLAVENLYRQRRAPPLGLSGATHRRRHGRTSARPG